MWGEVLVERVAVQGLCVGRGVGSESCCSRFVYGRGLGSESCCSRFVCGARCWFRELLFKVCVWDEVLVQRVAVQGLCVGELLVQRVAVQGLCVR